MIKRLLDNKFFKVIYRIIKGLFILLIVLYLVFVILQRVTGNASILGFRVFTVATGSMEPVYNINDVILVKEISPENIRVGDDLAYLGERGDMKGKLVTHRVIKIEGENGQERYTLKGVNNDYEDPSITSSQVYGKVQSKVYVINFINHVVKNKFGFFFLVFCPLVLVAFLEIADTIIAAKVEKNELRLIKKKEEENSSDDKVVETKKETEGEVDEEII